MRTGGGKYAMGMTGETPVWDPHFIQILRRSFSAVSTATIARVGAFFQIFRDLQDSHIFSRLKSQNFSENRPNFWPNEIHFIRVFQ